VHGNEIWVGEQAVDIPARPARQIADEEVLLRIPALRRGNPASITQKKVCRESPFHGDYEEENKNKPSEQANKGMGPLRSTLRWRGHGRVGPGCSFLSLRHAQRNSTLHNGRTRICVHPAASG
jgi:hypothetical protein